MEMQSKPKKKLYFIIFNLILLYILFNIPTNLELLNNICIFKHFTGKECWNCGMTRAFLSFLHFDFDKAFKYNNKVIIVFPLTVMIYLYSWYKYIFMKGEE